jgi:hypothetical protein
MEDIAEIAALACGSSLGSICSGSAPGPIIPKPIGLFQDIWKSIIDFKTA